MSLDTFLTFSTTLRPPKRRHWDTLEPPADAFFELLVPVDGEIGDRLLPEEGPCECSIQPLPDGYECYPVIVQIDSLTHADTVQTCRALTVDHIGVSVGDHELPGAVSMESAKEFIHALPDEQKSVACTNGTDVDTILDLANTLEPDILHVSTDRMDLPPADLFDIREEIPEGMELARSITVRDRGVVYPAMALDPIADWLLLDVREDGTQTGSSSDETDGWTISREIVESVTTSCILGGPHLTPANVTEAIETVRPAGVALGMHSLRDEGGTTDSQLRQFVENARSATVE